MPRANPELDVSYLGSLYKIVVSFNTLSFYYYHYVNEPARPTGRDFTLLLQSFYVVYNRFNKILPSFPWSCGQSGPRSTACNPSADGPDS